MKITKLLSILLVLFVGLNFSACSSDNDDNSDSPSSENLLIGTWELINEKGYYYDEDNKKISWEDKKGDEDWMESYIEFKSNGTCTYKDAYSESGNTGFDVYKGTWKLENKKLTMTDDDNDIDECTIKEFSKDKLTVFKYEGKDYMENTYSRVK